MSERWVLVTTPELTMLAATLVLALVHIFLPAAGRVMTNGFGWAAGPRDTAPEKGVRTQRLERAQANLWETLPIFIGAVLVAHVAGEDGVLTFWGTQAYFLGTTGLYPAVRPGVAAASGRLGDLTVRPDRRLHRHLHLN